MTFNQKLTSFALASLATTGALAQDKATIIPYVSDTQAGAGVVVFDGHPNKDLTNYFRTVVTVYALKNAAGGLEPSAFDSVANYFDKNGRVSIHSAGTYLNGTVQDARIINVVANGVNITLPPADLEDRVKFEKQGANIAFGAIAEGVATAHKLNKDGIDTLHTGTCLTDMGTSSGISGVAGYKEGETHVIVRKNGADISVSTNEGAHFTMKFGGVVPNDYMKYAAAVMTAQGDILAACRRTALDPQRQPLSAPTGQPTPHL